MILRKTEVGWIVLGAEDVKCKYCKEIITGECFVCTKHRIFFCADCAEDPKTPVRCGYKTQIGVFVAKVNSFDDCIYKKVMEVKK